MTITIIIKLLLLLLRYYYVIVNTACMPKQFYVAVCKYFTKPGGVGLGINK